jgi:sialidase-1
MINARHISTHIAHRQPGHYLGWPTVARLPSGELVAAFSGGRQRHVCPFGKTQLIRSKDHGETWSDAETVNDSPLDDRDGGLLVTPHGSLLLTWFTSRLFEKNFDRLSKEYGPEVTASWRDRIQALTPAILDEHLGNWRRRSTDGGHSWEPPVRMVASSPHGTTALSNGDLLHIGWVHDKKFEPLVVERSNDDGRSWQVFSRIPLPDDLGERGYLGEPHVAETAEGSLVALFRSVPSVPGVEKTADLPLFLYQSTSHDHGLSWSVPARTEIWGYPPHLLRMRDGNLLVSYSHRREPFGQRACILSDNGTRWHSQHIVEFPHAPNSDHGYPSTVETAPGEFLTLYYQIVPPDSLPCLVATRWALA